MTSRCTGILALACLVAFAMFWTVQTASARTWTSQDGRKVSGQFVRVHQGKVVLRRGRGVVQIPFEMFSEEDQDYIRNKLEGNGNGDLVPVKKSTSDTTPGTKPDTTLGTKPDAMPGTKPDAMPGTKPDAMPGTEERIWTDIQGRKITAKFVRMMGTLVVLNKGGKEIKVSIVQLSPADRQYAMRAGMRVRGSSVTEPWQTQQPPMRTSKEPMPPDNTIVESEMQKALRAEQERQKKAANRPQSPPSTSHTSSHAPHMPPSMPSHPRPSMHVPPTMPSTHHSPFQQTEVYQCSNCKKTITQKLKPGDKCPHCGIFIQYVQHEDGTREEASALSEIRWRGSRIFISIAAFVIIGVISAIFRNK